LKEKGKLFPLQNEEMKLKRLFGTKKEEEIVLDDEKRGRPDQVVELQFVGRKTLFYEKEEGRGESD